MTSFTRRVPTLLVALSLMHVGGCGSPTPTPEQKLTYAEALQIYNQELMALDRLQQQREKLQKSLAPDPSDLVGNLLERAGDYQAELEKSLEDLNISSGTTATETTEAQKTLDALEDKLGEGSRGPSVDRDEVLAKIAQLDDEIVRQQARVDRAKADRDAAEAQRP